MENLWILNTDRDLFGGFRGERFRQLLELCFVEADRFSLSRMPVPSYPNAVEDLLAPYLKKTVSTRDWFAYHMAPEGAPLTELIYEATPEARDILLQCYQDIFLQNRRRVPKKHYEQTGRQFLYPSVLEDLCFFKQKAIFFGTVSHEYICAAKSLSQAFENRLLALGPWQKTDRDGFGLGTIRL